MNETHTTKGETMTSTGTAQYDADARHYLTNEQRRNSDTVLKSGHGFDTRKRSNRAPNTTPNLSLADIDGGIDLEQLDALGVPVFRYETQVTIHGTWPELSYNARFDALGYKSLIRNKNGSLGVRYTAIDATKKQTLASAISLAKGCYSVLSDSKGFSLQIIKHATQTNLDRLREIAASFPDSAIIGHKGIYKASSLAGSFVWLEVRIQAIPATSLWRLIDHATNGKITSQADYDRHYEARKAKRDAENRAYEAERAKEKEEQAKRKAEIIADWESEGFTFYEGPKREGLYLIKPARTNAKAYVHTLFSKWGNRFKRSTAYSDSRERLPESAFTKGKNPGKYYSEKAQGFVHKGASC